MRTSMKYKDSAEGDKECTNCAPWIPSKTPKDLGGCKLVQNDDEVSPKGYSSPWPSALSHCLDDEMAAPACHRPAAACRASRSSDDCRHSSWKD